MPVISCIVALDDERGIGRGGDVPWHISGDLQRLKAMTMGHPLIMGRTTHEAIGRPLPGRTNIIITHDCSYHSEGAVTVHSLEDALAVARILDDEEIFIFGGGAVYAEALPRVERLYLTIVPGTHQADTFFPEFEDAFSRVVHREEHLDGETPHVFETRER